MSKCKQTDVCNFFYFYSFLCDRCEDKLGKSLYMLLSSELATQDIVGLTYIHYNLTSSFTLMSLHSIFTAYIILYLFIISPHQWFGYCATVGRKIMVIPILLDVLRDLHSFVNSPGRSARYSGFRITQSHYFSTFGLNSNTEFPFYSSWPTCIIQALPRCYELDINIVMYYSFLVALFLFIVALF